MALTEISYQMLDGLSFCDRERALPTPIIMLTFLVNNKYKSSSQSPASSNVKRIFFSLLKTLCHPMVFSFPGFSLPRSKVYQLSLLQKLSYLHTYCCRFIQREKHVTCPFDPMAANPEKQTAVALHYLTGRYVCDFKTMNSFYVNTVKIHD